MGTCRRLHFARPESVARPTFHGRPARKPFPSDDIGDLGIFGGDLHVRRKMRRVGGTHQKSNVVRLPRSVEASPRLHLHNRNFYKPRLRNMKAEGPRSAANLAKRRPRAGTPRAPMQFQDARQFRRTRCFRRQRASVWCGQEVVHGSRWRGTETCVVKAHVL